MKRPANVEEMLMAEESEIEHMMQVTENDSAFGY